MAERFFARKTTLDDAGTFMTDLIDNQEIGRASCRERV